MPRGKRGFARLALYVLDVAQVMTALSRPAKGSAGPLQLKSGALIFVLWFGALAGWSIATPVWQSPDEFAHASRAYSAIHGQVYVPPVRAFHGTGGFVTAPRGWLNAAHHYRCPFHRGRDARCLPPLTNDGSAVRVASTAARYNPLYYLAVGSASLFSGPAHAMRLMRLVSAALSALFLAWAFSAALTARRPRLAASTVLFAATPMVLFLGGAINPNGLEITAAICTWTCGSLAFATDNARVCRALIRRAAIALVVVVESRAISPLWAAIILVTLFAAAGDRRQLWSRHRTELVRWSVVLAAATASAGAWSQFAKSGELQQHVVHQLTFIGSLRQAWDGGVSELRWLTGTVGNFGWLNTPLPSQVAYTWLFAAAGMLLVAALACTARERGSLLGLGIVVVVLPTVISAVGWNRYGAFWQARYTMPISLGLVLLAGTSLARSEDRWPRERLVDLLAWALAAVAVTIDVIGFVVALSRYSQGAGRPISIIGRWQPPLGGPLVTALEFTCVCALGWIAVRNRTPSQPPTSAEAKRAAVIHVSTANPAALFGRHPVNSQVSQRG